jgi:hypothetical protein
MSITASIKFVFHDEIPFLKFTRALSDCSWVFSLNDRFSYWLGSTEEWVDCPADQAKDVLKLLDKLWNESNVGIGMHPMDGEEWNVTLNFAREQRNEVSIDFYNGKSLSPEYRVAIDFSWYIERILPVVKMCDLEMKAIFTSAYW